MPDLEQILKAAAEVERLAEVMKQIAADMKEDAQHAATRENAYGRVYWLRARLSKEVISQLGCGTPSGLKSFDRYLYN